MLEHTKKRPTEKLVPLHLMVHPANVATITKYVEQLENSDSIPWREVAGRRGSIPSPSCAAPGARLHSLRPACRS